MNTNIQETFDTEYYYKEFNIKKSHNGFIEIRDKYIEKYGYAHVSMDWLIHIIDIIGTNQPVLEIMAGKGFLSYALSKYGVNVIATDDLSWENEDIYDKWKDHYIDVENLKAVEAIKKYTNVKYIICSWPPYDEPHAADALKAMRKYNPDAIMIYIGEDYGGCTANNEFFNIAEEINNTEIDKISYIYTRNGFYGIHDDIVFIK